MICRFGSWQISQRQDEQIDFEIAPLMVNQKMHWQLLTCRRNRDKSHHG